ncbi:MAG TPA: DUF6498-containing protein [Kiritimatiellia bacterium]|nr:DUF6498-containing protein [Kiritimatiellia bacterium]
MVTTLIRLMSLLGLNSIPALGWFGGAWSEGTVMAIYWCESILMTLFIGLRILLHRIFTGKAGHLRPPSGLSINRRANAPAPKPGPNRFLSDYLTIMLAFLTIQGLFVFGLLMIFLPSIEGMETAALQPEHLRLGLAGIAALLLFAFLIDLPTLKQRPFAWIRGMTEHSTGRVIVFQFTILIGLPAMAFYDQPRLFFAVFIALKILLDVSIYLPRYEPKDPPAWLCRLMDRIPPPPGIEAQPGGFAAYWRRDAQEQRELQARDEIGVSP